MQNIKCNWLLIFMLVLATGLYSQNKVSNTNGNWSDPSVWTPTGVPTAANNVTISNGTFINIDANAICNSLTIGDGFLAYLNFAGSTARTLSVTNDIIVNNFSSFVISISSNVTHTLNTKGNIINYGSINFNLDADSRVVTLFTKNGNQSVSGNGFSTVFYNMNLNMGGSSNSILDISSTSFSVPVNFLSLTNGTFKLSTPNSVTVVPFSGVGTIPSTAGIWLNSSNAVMTTSASVNLSGKITVSAGVLNIGNAANEDLTSTSGTLSVSGGSLNISGKYNASSGASTFSLSGGILTVPSIGSTNTSFAPFHLSAAGSQFNMSGGLLVLTREGGGGPQNLGFTNTGSSSGTVSGGTVQIGNSTSPASQIISINSTYTIPNLFVNSSNVMAQLATNSLNVSGDVTINSGTLNPNSLVLNLNGNWKNNGGTLSAANGTINFNSNTAQSIFKSGGETFNALVFNGSGIKTFSSSVLTNSNFSISSGSTVDVSTSNYDLSIKGNFLNSGALNSRNGSVILNGNTAQTIGGTSTTDFYNLTLNNAGGASFTNAENLKGTLSLNNGTLNANGQLFTLISDATNTARIAQITGTGDYNGNVTIQRFAPGGSTGWAFLGSPISSALTLNDWDDDIVISCPTCPDGIIGGFSSVYTYDETVPGVYDAGASYLPLSTINDPIVAGKGYWIYLGNAQYTTSDITLDLTGVPRKFNYTIPLNYTNSGSSIDDGWNLISNPYPSAISWTALKGSTSNIDNAIYVYNADLNSGSGGYASYVNGVSSPAVVSGGIGDNIPMGQGFYVHSTGATSLNAQESNKVSANPVFLKSSSSSLAPDLLRILLKNSVTVLDETVLYFDQNATIGFDQGYDSYKMRGQDPYAPSIALENTNHVFQINGIAPVSGTLSIPLKTLTGYAGTYTISTDNIGSFPKGACVQLYDKFTATTTDLRTSDYVFNLSDTTTIARFDLIITLNHLSISSQVIQPTCSSPAQGKITASGNSSGPWNYYWSKNDSLVKTSLNVTTVDSISNLTGGIYELEINSVGQCDHNETSFFIQEQVPVISQFISLDNLNIAETTSVQFTNTSVNNVSNYWNFGFNSDFSTIDSPSYNYSVPGNYTVTLETTSSSGCKDTAYKVITVINNAVGIQLHTPEINELKVKRLSNNEYTLHWDLKQSTSVLIKLFDLSGKLMADYGTKSYELLNFNLELSQYKPGIYLLCLTLPQERKWVKLIVE